MSQQVTLVREKECKHSIRFALPATTSQAEQDAAPVTNVYVSRKVPGIEDAQSVNVTLEIAE